ncbi:MULTISPECIES: putative protein N(5)-glutamine methyltransferase [Isoptericola]|uniref:putative protein N(5)-glutamine methyltransferase n=1 Tax=Isoptericola TaxID=254250 RepID=UPI000D068890|nr:MULTISPECIES: putative protein N(5)-glutamine methyltransferase [Isoptericola]
MSRDEDALVARLRAAGCVFAEDEARLLLEHVGRTTGAAPAAAAAPEAAPEVAAADELAVLVARRVAGEPLEHLLGWVELAGHRWSVGPGVFVPRRRTELMVRTALQGTPRAADVVVDLCCGCGAVGGAVALGLQGGPGPRTRPGRPVELHASDVDAAAVAHARRNLAPLGGTVHQGDLFDPLPAHLRGGVDVLLCHAPYVPTAAIPGMPPEARDHEPVAALDGGTDGLDVLRRVVAAAPGWLRPGGRLLFEVGSDQVDGALALVAAAALVGHVVRDEDDDGPGGTVVVATAADASAAGGPA